jgi:hypothetical protein
MNPSLIYKMEQYLFETKYNHIFFYVAKKIKEKT